MAQLSDGTFSKTGNPDEFNDVKNNLMYHDRYYTMADYDAYIAAQDKVNETYKVPTYQFLKVIVKFILFNFLEMGTLGQNGNYQCGLIWQIQFRQNHC